MISRNIGRILMGCLGIAFIIVLASCAGDSQTRAINALAISCDSYATALEQATPYKRKMSAVVVKRIDDANEKVVKVCTSNVASGVSDAITMVEQAITLIKTAREGVQ